MPNLGGWEFVILIGVLVLLFGAKRLPDMARSIGQSARVFKGEMKGMKNDDPKPADPPVAPSATAPTTAPAPNPAPPVAPPAELPPAAPAPVQSTQNGAPEASRVAGQGPAGAK
jgi:sec-independent protein translocase protein TatA